LAGSYGIDDGKPDNARRVLRFAIDRNRKPDLDVWRGFTSFVAHTGTPLRIDDINKRQPASLIVDGQMRSIDLVRDEKIWELRNAKAYAAHPVRIDGQIIGVLRVVRTDARPAFDDGVLGELERAARF